jgi:thiaminase (transcriptional activator TenA)
MAGERLAGDQGTGDRATPPPLHRRLWEENQDLVEACLHHPFVTGLAAGDLPRDAFRGYVAQDAFFLGAFRQAYALALARCTEPGAAAFLQELLTGATQELRLHEAYSEELGIVLEAARPTPACRAYTDFLLRTAWHDGLAETLAAMTPCMRLYAYLGRQLTPALREGHPYRRWIETYSAGEFDELASRMEALLDQSAGAARPPGAAAAEARLRDCYRYAMLCERDFFSNALQPGGTPGGGSGAPAGPKEIP